MDKNKLDTKGRNDEKEIVIGLKVKPKSNKVWLVQIFFTSLCLSVLFALISELTLSHASLALALILICLLVGTSVLFDLIGVAITACNIKPLLQLQQKGVRGAGIAVKLVKNADKVSCVCSDVIGDICSILSGAGGVAISIIIVNLLPNFSNILMSIIISSVIASITILGKAIGKTYALNDPVNIVLRVGRCLSIFKKSSKK